MISSSLSSLVILDIIDINSPPDASKDNLPVAKYRFAAGL